MSEGGYGANGGVPGHDSRRRATTVKEDVNDEVLRDRGACVEGWEEIWLVRAVEEALIVSIGRFDSAPTKARRVRP